MGLHRRKFLAGLLVLPALSLLTRLKTPTPPPPAPVGTLWTGSKRGFTKEDLDRATAETFAHTEDPYPSHVVLDAYENPSKDLVYRGNPLLKMLEAKG